MTKPFHFEELLARVRALLRRKSHDKSAVLQVGGLVLDPVSRKSSEKESKSGERQGSLRFSNISCAIGGRLFRAFILPSMFGMSASTWNRTSSMFT